MITNEYGLAERQTELLQLLKDVDRLMSENGIRYSLCGGTLLGAIRHNGFIPWDDDLDIMCDRDNHEKLVQLFRQNDGVVRLRTEAAGINQEDSGLVLNRILWIYRIQREGDLRDGLNAATVDVLVMDHCPDNPVLRRLKVLAIRIMQGMMHERVNWKDHSFFMTVCLAVTWGFGRLFSQDFKFRLYHRISRIGNKRDTKFITGYNDYYSLLTLRYTGRLMDSFIPHSFEDTELPITAEYENYLITQYGDYMTPPKESDRVPIHLAY